MRFAALLVGLGLAVSASAQTQLPIPAFANTFTSTLTRGFWFQAPTGFVITGLRVPDESSQGTQTVEVMRLPSTPPAYPGTITGTQLFYSTGQPSANIIPVAIPVAPNDFIGILGCCGSTAANSYATPNGPFVSSIFGNPVTLTRLLTQTNLPTTGGNQPVSQEAAFQIARVEVYIAPAAGFASSVPYGTGCYDSSRTVFENLPTAGFDLNATSMQAIFTGTNYVYVAGGAFIAPTAAATTLALSDDSETTVSLPSPFLFPSGPTSSLVVCSNGFVSKATGNGTAFTPDVNAWHNSTQDRHGNWHDFNPASTGSGAVKFEVVGNVAIVTWDGVFDFGTTAPNTWQLQFDLGTGTVTTAWQSMSGLGSTPHLIGFSALGASRNLGSIDISVRLTTGGFQTGATDSAAMVLASSARPVLGTSIQLVSTDVPASATIGATILSFTELTAGVDLSSFGAPGCRQYAGFDATNLFIPSSGTGSTGLTLPLNPIFAGVVVATQSAAFAPLNALGVVFSNGLRLTADIN